MKLPHHQDYSPETTERCISALLSVWARLADHAQNIVLVGGLVPRFLCKQRPGDLQVRTLDVDLGIALTTSTGQYDTVSTRLLSQGFVWKDKRFSREFDGHTLFIDFLTEREMLLDHNTVKWSPQSVLSERFVQNIVSVVVFGRFFGRFSLRLAKFLYIVRGHSH